jgi:hypothetical protein
LFSGVSYSLNSPSSSIWNPFPHRIIFTSSLGSPYFYEEPPILAL